MTDEGDIATWQITLDLERSETGYGFCLSARGQFPPALLDRIRRLGELAMDKDLSHADFIDRATVILRGEDADGR